MIALWGFTEAVFGGVLHLLRIPFTGLFIGSAAVIYISLIAQSSDSKSVILKATIIVILVKAFVSPHSPLTAYFAVTVQGLLGYCLFSQKGSERITAPLLGLLALVLSGIQKIVIMTLLFGKTLWNSIDEFVVFILRQLGMQTDLPYSFSMTIIAIYLAVHLAAGLYAGILSLRIPVWIHHQHSFNSEVIINHRNDLSIFNREQTKKKKKWWSKRSGLIIILFGIIFSIVSLFSPEMGRNKAVEIFIMFARSIIITLAWFYLISPVIIKLFKKFVKSKQSEYANEMNAVMELFPSFKKITSYVYEHSKNEKGIKRVKIFFTTWFILMLTSETKIQ